MRCLLQMIAWLVAVAYLGGTGSACAGEDGSASISAYLAKRAARLDARPQTTLSVTELLGLPPREPMKAAVTCIKHEGELAVEEVIYHWAGPTYAAGHVIRQKPAKQPDARLPAVVVCPGDLAHYTWLGYRDFVDRMARAGLVVLFVEDPRIGKRHAADVGLYAVAAAAGMPMTGIQTFDALRGLDYLLTRPDVDHGRIGIVGVGSGAQHARLAAAIDSRFQAAAIVGGDLTPSAIAPASGPKAGTIVEFRGGPNQDPAACIPQLLPWIAQHLIALPASSAAAIPCAKPEKPDFKVMSYFRGRMAQRTAARAKSLESFAQWDSYRKDVARWLEEACALKTMQPGTAKVIAKANDQGLVVETIRLAVDAGLNCPALLVHPPASGSEKRPGVILSHEGRLAAEAPELQGAVRQLATQGYWVLVPDHISLHVKSGRKVDLADVPAFFAAADRAALSPLAIRVAEDLAAFRYLAGRAEVDRAQIVIGGSGIGAIDACLSAVLEAGIAGVAAVNVTTLRDWAENVAPEETTFVHPLPYLPGILAKTDLDCCFAALAPRPLALARLKEGWPKSGFDQVAATSAAVYRLAGAYDALLTLGLRDPIDERIAKAREGVRKQTAAVVRAMLPVPPVPGIVGNREGLRKRDGVDSATGVVWLLNTVGGEEQEFCDDGYHLDTWTFFNGNGAAQRGSAVTPLIFKKEGDAYKLTGIGKTRVNAGSGLQTFPFEAAQGSDRVGAGCYFGFFTGDQTGKPNAGVVEYNDDYQDRMIILTLDGAMGDQKIALGRNYRENSRWPRAYSIQAVSKRK